MHSVIIDTNILVSAIIQRNYPYYIMYDMVGKDKINLCISDDLIKEYEDVLFRPKFRRYLDFYSDAKIMLTLINAKAKKYNPRTNISLIKDEPDNRLLELADESNADFIITGNTNDFTFPFYKNTQIVSPKDFWENFQ